MISTYSYITRDNPAAAARTVQGIYEKAQVVATFPEVGYRFRGSTDRPIRILLCGHYRIAYLVEEEGAITIRRLAEGRAFHAATGTDHTNDERKSGCPG